MMTVTEKILVKSGDPAPESGYYLYKKNAVRGEIPCMPTKKEKVIKLTRGDPVPHIASCGNHAALYKLVLRTNQQRYS